VVQRIPVMKEGQLEGGEKEDSGEGTGEGREGEGEEEEVERHSSSREGVGWGKSWREGEGEGERRRESWEEGKRLKFRQHWWNWWDRHRTGKEAAAWGGMQAVTATTTSSVCCAVSDTGCWQAVSSGRSWTMLQPTGRRLARASTTSSALSLMRHESLPVSLPDLCCVWLPCDWKASLKLQSLSFCETKLNLVLLIRSRW
jgi:hypothetical protein